MADVNNKSTLMSMIRIPYIPAPRLVPYTRPSHKVSDTAVVWISRIRQKQCEKMAHFEIALVGDAMVGKSAILERYITDAFSPSFSMATLGEPLFYYIGTMYFLQFRVAIYVNRRLHPTPNLLWHIRTQARIAGFQKGVTWVDLGGRSLKKSEIASKARPFWDRSRAVVATWLAEYCIQFSAVWLQRQQNKPVQLPLHCWWWITRRQLVNSRAPELAIYLLTLLRASFHRSCVNRSHSWSTFSGGSRRLKGGSSVKKLAKFTRFELLRHVIITLRVVLHSVVLWPWLPTFASLFDKAYSQLFYSSS